MSRKPPRKMEPFSSYGSIEVLEIVNNRPRLYHARCKKCGNEWTAGATAILKFADRGYCGRCGKMLERERKDEEARQCVGKTFGDLTVVEYIGLKNASKGAKYGVTFVKCKCDRCGSVTEMPLTRLKTRQAQICRYCGRKNLDDGRELIKECSVEGTNVISLRRKSVNRNSSTGVTGVSQKGNKYRAYINFKRKQYDLGLYDNKDDAAKARKAAEEKIYGEFLEWYAENYPEQWARINKK